jgi:RNA polymerase sigma-70 factor (ECF subfamily)
MTCEFHELLVNELARMGRYALTLASGNKTVAEDLLQETAMKACGAQSQFVRGTNFKAWLWRILRNEYIAVYRGWKKAPLAIEGLDESLFGREGDQESKAVSGEMLRAFGRLPEARRNILMLKFWDELRYDEIAVVLGCPVGTVRSRISRARRELHGLMHAEAAVPPAGRRLMSESAVRH